MFIGSQQQFAPDPLQQRLAGVLHGLKMSNGTPAEDVVATVLQIYHQIGEGERQAALNLPDVPFRNFALDIVDAIEAGPSHVELPAGNTLQSDDTGLIDIEVEEWVLVARKPENSFWNEIVWEQNEDGKKSLICS